MKSRKKKEVKIKGERKLGKNIEPAKPWEHFFI